MVLSVFNIMRNGTASPMHFTKSSITQERMVVVKDDKNKKIWLFTGLHVNTEVVRLGRYAIDELNPDNFTIHEISMTEWDEKADYLFHLNRNPEYEIQIKEPGSAPASYSEAKPLGSLSNVVVTPTEEKTEIKSISTSREKENIAETESIKPKKPASFSKPQSIGAPLPPSRSGMKASDASTYLEGKSTPEQMLKEKKQSKKKLTEPVNSVSSVIPSPPSTPKTPDRLDDLYKLIGDFKPGPIIEEFQISYYEKTGGANFILIEELSKKIDKAFQFTQIRNLINALNDLADRDATQLAASKVLTKQLDVLIKSLYRN